MRANCLCSAQRIATDSPLLRLPPEIRALIWDFTLSYEVVLLPWHQQCTAGAVRLKNNQASSQDKTIWGTDENDYERIPSAFHLPEVCRQIYSETAIAAYSKSTFVLTDDFITHPSNIKRLKAIQRRAITSIELHHGVLLCGLVYHFVEMPFRQTFFPNIKTIIIDELAFKAVQRTIGWLNHKIMSEGDCKKWLAEFLKESEGADIQVRIKDHDPSW